MADRVTPPAQIVLKWGPTAPGGGGEDTAIAFTAKFGLWSILVGFLSFAQWQEAPPMKFHSRLNPVFLFSPATQFSVHFAFLEPSLVDLMSTLVPLLSLCRSFSPALPYCVRLRQTKRKYQINLEKNVEPVGMALSRNFPKSFHEKSVLLPIVSRRCCAIKRNLVFVCDYFVSKTRFIRKYANCTQNSRILPMKCSRRNDN